MGGGGDIGQAAQAVITYLSGAAGGALLLLAMIVVAILVACHMMRPHSLAVTFGVGMLAWGSAALVHLIGWA